MDVDPWENAPPIDPSAWGPNISPELRQALIDADQRFRAMTSEQRKAMYRAQRDSWVRAMSTPCEHGELDWEQWVRACLRAFGG